MKLQRAATTILKADVSSPLLALLTPAIATLRPYIANSRVRSRIQYSNISLNSRRCLSTNLRRLAPASAAEARRLEEDQPNFPPERQPPPSSPSGQSSTAQGFASSLHEHEKENSYAGSRISKPRRGLRNASYSRPNSSGSQISQTLVSDLVQNIFPGSRNRSPTSDEQLRSERRTQTEHKQDILAGRSLYSVSKDVVSDGIISENRVSIQPPVPRLDAYMGRAIKVDNIKYTLPRALAIMNANVAQNGIKHEFYYQRFHERKGLKRKRLKSERWRKRFKEGFKAMVEKVKFMRRQGW